MNGGKSYSSNNLDSYFSSESHFCNNPYNLNASYNVVDKIDEKDNNKYINIID